MSGPSPQQITVSARQQAVLAQIIRRASSPQQQVRRATLILAAGAGAPNAEAARRAAVSRETARRWRARWAAVSEALLAAEAAGGAEHHRALEALVLRVFADAPRPGAPATIAPEQWCQIMALACTPPDAAGRPIDHWTPRELADEAVQRGIAPRLSASSVGRFLKRARPQAAPQPVLAHARAG